MPAHLELIFLIILLCYFLLTLTLQFLIAWIDINVNINILLKELTCQRQNVHGMHDFNGEWVRLRWGMGSTSMELGSTSMELGSTSMENGFDFDGVGLDFDGEWVRLRRMD